MGKQRLIRFFILALVFVSVIFFLSNLSEKKRESDFQGVNFPRLKIPESNLLEKAQKVILGAKDEPIAEPVENVQSQTDSLLESIKKLPEDQVEAIKKQLFKEFCQDYCQGAESREEDDR